MANVGTLWADLKLNVSGFSTGLRQAQAQLGQFQTAAGQAERKMGLLGKAVVAVGGVFAAQQILQFGTALWKVGMQVEASEARFKSMFGVTGTSLRQWSEENAAAFGTGADDLRGYIAQVSNLMIPWGMTTEQAGRQATEVLELARAWSAYSGGGRTVEDVTAALMKGMAGQTRGLIDLGMKITDSALAAEVAALGLSGLTGVENDQAEALARLNIFRDRSNQALQVERELSTGALGAQRQLASAIDQAQDAMGMMVLRFAPLIAGLAKMGSVPILGTSVMGAIAGGMIGGIPGMAIGAFIGPLAEGMQPIAALVAFNNKIAEGFGLIVQALRGTPEEAAAAGNSMRKLGGDFGYAAGHLDDLKKAFDALDVVGYWTRTPAAAAFRFASGRNVLGEHVGVTERMAGFTSREFTDVLERSLINPAKYARREVLQIMTDMSYQIGSIINGIPTKIPHIDMADVLENALELEATRKSLAEMTAGMGAAGLWALITNLTTLTPEEQMAIARLWADIGNRMEFYRLNTILGGFGGYTPGEHVGISEMLAGPPDTGVTPYSGGSPPGGGGGPAAPAAPGWPMGGGGMAAGGPVFGGWPYRVGERGPETFIPNMSGTILPNGTGMGGGIVVNIGQAVGDETSVERMVTTAIRRARTRGNVRWQ